MIYTDDVREKCAKLYKQGFPIKDIMHQTGLRSTQTVYRILREGKIPARNTDKKGGKVITVSLDKEAVRIIKLKKPRNLSNFVCAAIHAYINIK